MLLVCVLEIIISYFYKFYLLVIYFGGFVVDIELFVGSVIVDFGFDFGFVGGVFVFGVDSTDRFIGGLAVMDVGLEIVSFFFIYCVYIFYFF